MIFRYPFATIVAVDLVSEHGNIRTCDNIHSGGPSDAAEVTTGATNLPVWTSLDPLSKLLLGNV